METDIYRNGEYIRLIGTGDNGLGEAYIDTFLPYDPSVEYTAESRHNIEVRYRRSEIYAEGYGDYYNYIEYTYGNPVYYPIQYDFVGPGPDTTTPFSSILLGITNALFSEGSRVGPPHHVKVVSDTGQRQQDCTTVRRLIKFQVVDSAGRRTGTVPVGESFFDPQSGTPVNSVTNSCRNNEQIYPSGCAPTDQWSSPFGQFTDQLWVGCPTVTFSCGTSAVSRWSWCPRGRPAQALTTNRYEARRDSVLINGVTEYAPGTQLY